jgi:hypothetical protein
LSPLQCLVSISSPLKRHDLQEKIIDVPANFLLFRVFL